MMIDEDANIARQYTLLNQESCELIISAGELGNQLSVVGCEL